MNESKISVRYSRALFQSAADKKILDKVNNDMIFISELCKSPEVKDFLQSPVIPPSKKTKVLHSLCEKNVEKITLSLIDLVVKNGREIYLPAIARVFMDETIKYKGITRSVLTTASPVDPEISKKIISLVSGVFKTEVQLEEMVDPDIIGGFILRVGDSYIDASVKNKLGRIKKELLKSPIS